MSSRPKATDSLSADGTTAMLAGFAAKKTNAEIAADIRKATGERVAARTIGRRKADYWLQQRERDRAYEQMRALVRVLRDEPKLSEIVVAKFRDLLMRGVGEITAKEALKAEELMLKRDQLEFGRERFAARVKEKGEKLITDKSGELSEETKQRIRELYDVREEVADAA